MATRSNAPLSVTSNRHEIPFEVLVRRFARFLEGAVADEEGFGIEVRPDRHPPNSVPSRLTEAEDAGMVERTSNNHLPG